MQNEELPLFGGKTLDDWDLKWVTVPACLKDYQPQFRYLIGLYRVTLNGRTMVIGTGTDKSGGLSKRLSDLRRKSPSGRNHHAGRLIFADRDKLEVQVLITGERHEPALARKLKALMIPRYQPAWSVPNARFMRKG